MSGEADLTYDLSLLVQSAAKWERSPGLRLYYQSLYADLQPHLVNGASLEIGSGIGIGKQFIPDLVTTDIVQTEYVDRAASAYALEALSQRWDNILALDVFHHLREPLRFLESAASVLNPGGRLLLMEPAATPWARLFYGLCHPEPVQPASIQAPYSFTEVAGQDFSNMAMSQSMLIRDALDLQPYGLTVRRFGFRDVIAYAFTGGYSQPQLLPTGCLKLMLRLESLLPQAMLRQLGLRVWFVLEKTV